jgi:hypothetical protein
MTVLGPKRRGAQARPKYTIGGERKFMHTLVPRNTDTTLHKRLRIPGRLYQDVPAIRADEGLIMAYVQQRGARSLKTNSIDTYDFNGTELVILSHLDSLIVR